MKKWDKNILQADTCTTNVMLSTLNIHSLQFETFKTL